MEAKERILVALDTQDIGRLNELARTLGPHVGGFKIGLEALLSIGLTPALNAVRGYGTAGDAVFVDAKIHDIGNTMAGAVRAVVKHPQVKFVNLHASAGVDGMRMAAEAKGPRAKLLAVTVLTSLSPSAAAEIYGDFGWKHDPSVNSLVMKFAAAARDAGCDGVVCSAREAVALRRAMPPEFALVTPGIRPLWSAKNDQERVTTPAEAIANGATYLVIGRPITDPPKDVGSPVAAAKLIADEIATALR